MRLWCKVFADCTTMRNSYNCQQITSNFDLDIRITDSVDQQQQHQPSPPPSQTRMSRSVGALTGSSPPKVTLEDAVPNTSFQRQESILFSMDNRVGSPHDRPLNDASSSQSGRRRRTNLPPLSMKSSPLLQNNLNSNLVSRSIDSPVAMDTDSDAGLSSLLAGLGTSPIYSLSNLAADVDMSKVMSYSSTSAIIRPFGGRVPIQRPAISSPVHRPRTSSVGQQSQRKSFVDHTDIDPFGSFASPALGDPPVQNQQSSQSAPDSHTLSGCDAFQRSVSTPAYSLSSTSPTSPGTFGMFSARGTANVGLDRDRNRLLNEILLSNSSRITSMIGSSPRAHGNSVSRRQSSTSESVGEQLLPQRGRPSDSGSFLSGVSSGSSMPVALEVHEQMPDTASEHSPERYRLLEKVNHGAFADIYRAHDNLFPSTTVAVKEIKIVPEFPSGSDAEFQITSSLDHEHIIKCLGRYYVGVREHIVIQFCNEGDLFDKLENVEADVEIEEQCRRYIQQAADGLEYVHSQDLVHFDIKLENMLIHNGILKLCDFGLSGRHGSMRVGKPHGTCAYMPHELIGIESPNDRYCVQKAADVWAFAVVIYVVIFADLPWDKAIEEIDDDYAEFRDDCRTGLVSRVQPWALLEPTMQHTIFRMLAPNPDERPPMSEVVLAVRQSWLLDLEDECEFQGLE